jgi:hypothetical protein
MFGESLEFKGILPLTPIFCLEGRGKPKAKTRLVGRVL